MKLGRTILTSNTQSQQDALSPLRAVLNQECVCVLSSEYEAYLSKESGRLLWQKIRASIKIVCKPNHVFVALFIWLFCHGYHSRALRSCRSFVLHRPHHYKLNLITMGNSIFYEGIFYYHHTVLFWFFLEEKTLSRPYFVLLWKSNSLMCALFT